MSFVNWDRYSSGQAGTCSEASPGRRPPIKTRRAHFDRMHKQLAVSSDPIQFDFGELVYYSVCRVRTHDSKKGRNTRKSLQHPIDPRHWVEQKNCVEMAKQAAARTWICSSRQAHLTLFCSKQIHTYIYVYIYIYICIYTSASNRRTSPIFLSVIGTKQALVGRKNAEAF
jgi:hypothetical protein